MNILLNVWLIGAAAYYAVMLLGLVRAQAAGVLQIKGLDSWRERAVWFLDEILHKALGEALTWPASLAVLAIRLRHVDLAELEDIEIQSGNIKIPPQDERSQAQTMELLQRLDDELKASLSVSPLVKFFPLLQLSWREFRVGAEEVFTSEESAKLFFMACAQGFTRGELSCDGVEPRQVFKPAE